MRNRQLRNVISLRLSLKHNADVNKHFCLCSLFLLKSCWHVLIRLQKLSGKKKFSNVKIIMPLSLVRKDNSRERGDPVEVKISWGLGGVWFGEGLASANPQPQCTRYGRWPGGSHSHWPFFIPQIHSASSHLGAFPHLLFLLGMLSPLPFPQPLLILQTLA